METPKNEKKPPQKVTDLIGAEADCDNCGLHLLIRPQDLPKVYLQDAFTEEYFCIACPRCGANVVLG